MNKNKLVNNQYRKQEFNKRRKFGKAESLCKSNGNCPVFQNCLLEIDQLTNNWNELEEYIENEWKVVAESPDGSFYDGYDTCMEEMKKDILDKMKEIKEGNNER